MTRIVRDQEDVPSLTAETSLESYGSAGVFVQCQLIWVPIDVSQGDWRTREYLWTEGQIVVLDSTIHSCALN